MQRDAALLAAFALGDHQSGDFPKLSGTLNRSTFLAAKLSKEKRRGAALSTGLQKCCPIAFSHTHSRDDQFREIKARQGHAAQRDDPEYCERRTRGILSDKIFRREFRCCR
jgi:hypothetical protein